MSTQLSPNGQWFAYNIELIDGDGWLTIKNVGTVSNGIHKLMRPTSQKIVDGRRS